MAAVDEALRAVLKVAAVMRRSARCGSGRRFGRRDRRGRRSNVRAGRQEG